MAELWRPCRRGYPDPDWCPADTPMWSERCYDTTYVNPCRVIGTHDVNEFDEILHRDGRGATWCFDPADQDSEPPSGGSDRR